MKRSGRIISGVNGVKVGASPRASPAVQRFHTGIGIRMISVYHEYTGIGFGKIGDTDGVAPQHVGRDCSRIITRTQDYDTRAWIPHRQRFEVTVRRDKDKLPAMEYSNMLRSPCRARLFRRALSDPGNNSSSRFSSFGDRLSSRRSFTRLRFADWRRVQRRRRKLPGSLPAPVEGNRP